MVENGEQCEVLSRVRCWPYGNDKFLMEWVVMGQIFEQSPVSDPSVS